MPRLPYAAKVLIETVQAEKPKATYEVADEPDGFGVHRTIKFDKRTSKWLEPILDQIEDERIEDCHLTDNGYLHVTYVAGPVADQRWPYPIADAAEVARATSTKH